MRYIQNKVFLILIIGVISMLNNYGCTDNFKFTQHCTIEPELNLCIDYISNWHYLEHKGSDYASILFFEKKKSQTFKAKIVVTATDIAKMKENISGLEAMVDNLITRRLKFKEAKVLSKAGSDILGLKAYDILLTYKGMDKIYSIDAKLISIKERIIIFKKGEKFYSLRYENKENDFDNLSSAFNHIVKSLKFKGNS